MSIVNIVMQSLLPLAFYLLLQIMVFLTGINLNSGEELRRWDNRSILKTYISGQMLIWAVLQIIAVPMILCRNRFNALFYMFVVLVIVLGGNGCRLILKLKRKQLKVKNNTDFPLFARIVCLALIILIVLQVFSYFLGQHIDQDDARWIAEANDALVYGDMMTRYVSTGDLVGGFETFRDVTSPWPMFFAILAKMLHINVPFAAHTLYAPVALLISYGVYYLIADELFEKAESRFAFLFTVAWINLFFAGTTHTQSVVTLVRIWQGKATVAAIIIPLLLYLAICINKRNERIDWIRLSVTGCAACLMSGMGISLGGILIAGIGAYSIMAYRRWNRIPYWLLSLAPAIGFFLVLFFLKG